jgi:hypothetical protein
VGVKESKMKNIAIIFSLILLAVNVSAKEPIVIQKSGKLKSGHSYSIKIIEKNFIKKPDSKEDDGSVWGIDGGFPSTVVDIFKVEINNVAVVIPWKFYADITNVREAGIIESADVLILTVEGGDAAGSYTAEYSIKDNRLIERIVRVGEFPVEVWEKTILHNELWNNNEM